MAQSHHSSSREKSRLASPKMVYGNKISDHQRNRTSLDNSSVDNNDVASATHAGQGFETFVMTGDMIIRTSRHDGNSLKKSQQKKRKQSNQNVEEGIGEADKKKMSETKGNVSGIPKKKPQSRIPQPKSAGNNKDSKASSEPAKQPTSRIPKPGSSLENSPKSSPTLSPKKLQQPAEKLSRLPQLQNLQYSPYSSRKKCYEKSDDSTVVENLEDMWEPLPVESINNNSVLECDVEQNDEKILIDNSENCTFEQTVSSVQAVSTDNDYNFPISPQPYPVLDIPPDDITSDDFVYKNIDAFVDLEELPPPPDELLCDIKEKQSFEVNLPYSESDQVVPHANNSMPPTTSIQTDLSETTADDNSQGHNILVDWQEDNLTQNVEKDISSTQSTPSEKDFSLCQSEVPVTESSPLDSPKTKLPAASGIPVKKSNSNSSGTGVRTSKSHENYLESNNMDTDLTCMDIDFEDNIASSVDALHYNDKSSAVVVESHSKKKKVPTATLR